MDDKNTLEKRVSDLEQKVSFLEGILKPLNLAELQKQVNKKLLSEKEYLLEKKPADDVQKTFYLGNYLEEHKGIGSFTVEDLRSAFQAAREPVPGNINDKINKNIAKGYFMESDPKDGKKAWVLTATGEKVANNAINKD